MQRRFFLEQDSLDCTACPVGSSTVGHTNASSALQCQPGFENSSSLVLNVRRACRRRSLQTRRALVLSELRYSRHARRRGVCRVSARPLLPYWVCAAAALSGKQLGRAGARRDRGVPLPRHSVIRLPLYIYIYFYLHTVLHTVHSLYSCDWQMDKNRAPGDRQEALRLTVFRNSVCVQAGEARFGSPDRGLQA